MYVLYSPQTSKGLLVRWSVGGPHEPVHCDRPTFRRAVTAITTNHEVPGQRGCLKRTKTHPRWKWAWLLLKWAWSNQRKVRRKWEQVRSLCTREGRPLSSAMKRSAHNYNRSHSFTFSIVCNNIPLMNNVVFRSVIAFGSKCSIQKRGLLWFFRN